MIKIIVALSITLILILSTFCVANQSDELHINVIDVSWGDAMILHQPDSCSILIDAGQLFYANRVINKLNELGVRSLDMVIISHPDDDHFGGLFDILTEFPAAKFFDNGYERERYPQFDEYKKLRDLQPYSTLAYGDVLNCGKVKISVLHPSSLSTTVTNINNTSLVLMISYEDFRLINMADLEHDGEKKLIEANDDLKANIIKIGHHGMKNATSRTLLKRAAPAYAVISSSGKFFGDDAGWQPDETVLNLLTDSDIPYSRTDKDGNIEIVVNQDGFDIHTSVMK